MRNLARASHRSLHVVDGASRTGEALIWQGAPSQLMNLGPFLLGALLFWAVAPVIWAGWCWLVTRTTNYRVTSERIAIRTGVFNVRVFDVPLYRVKDQSIYLPLWLRLFRLGHIDLVTSDKQQPRLRLAALPQPAVLHEQLYRAVDRARRINGVREIDLA